MKTMKYFSGILVFLICTSFSTYKKKTLILEEKSLAKTELSHVFKTYNADLLISIEDSIKIKSLKIQQTEEENPFIVEFNLDNLKSSYLENQFISSSDKVNKLLRIYVCSEFSEYSGGKIYISVYKSKWEKDSLFVKKNPNEKGFGLYIKNTKKSYNDKFTRINNINVDINFWTTRVKDYNFE